MLSTRPDHVSHEYHAAFRAVNEMPPSSRPKKRQPPRPRSAEVDRSLPSPFIWPIARRLSPPALYCERRFNPGGIEHDRASQAGPELFAESAGSLPDGYQAARDPRMSKTSARAADHEIATHREIESATRRCAFHQGNHRNRTLVQNAQHTSTTTLDSTRTLLIETTDFAEVGTGEEDPRMF